MKYLLCCLLGWSMASLALASETILLADFNNKPLNQPIGTGGAALGEPHQVSAIIAAVVRAAPGGGRELELLKEPSFGTASIRFHFLENEEVTEGQVRVSVDVRLGTPDDFSRITLLLRESFNSAQSFLNLDLSNNGETQIRRSGLPTLRFDNTVELSALNRVEVLYDLDESTFSICLNGQFLASDLESGITTTRGIGSILLSLPAAGDTVVWLDAVEAQKGAFGNGGGGGDRLFADRFQSGPPSCSF